MSEPVDEPTRSYLRHPGADQRETLTGKEQLVIPVLQCTKREFQAGRFCN